uniref:Uncharacterized protein n=1 Tax=Arundo donax TaxID=35708 RepID=A0A0A9BXK6_ARUDO
MSIPDEQELLGLLKQMKKDASPRPDGLNVAFYRAASLHPQLPTSFHPRPTHHYKHYYLGTRNCTLLPPSLLET